MDIVMHPVSIHHYLINTEEDQHNIHILLTKQDIEVETQIQMQMQINIVVMAIKYQAHQDNTKVGIILVHICHRTTKLKRIKIKIDRSWIEDKHKGKWKIYKKYHPSIRH